MAASSQLRLFSPDNHLPHPASMNLRQAWDIVAKPTFLNAKKSTLTEYVAAINRWEEYTDNPAILEIDDAACDSFTQSVLDSDAVENTTYNKWARHLRGIFNRLGPRDSRNKLGKGIMPMIPIIQFLNEELSEPRIIPLDHISRMYDACRVAKWPNRGGIPPMVRWQTLLVLLYNLGQRRDDALLLSDQSFFEGKCLRWIAKKTRKKQCVPMHPVVQAHLKLIPHNGLTSLLGISTTNRRDFYGTWKAIIQAAEVPPYIPKDFRKTCATELDYQVEGAASWVLGHAEGVTRKHYINPTEKVTRAVMAMRQPEAFLRILQDPLATAQ